LRGREARAFAAGQLLSAMQLITLFDPQRSIRFAASRCIVVGSGRSTFDLRGNCWRAKGPEG